MATQENLTETEREAKANKYFRAYYELGCLCVLTNRIKRFEGADDAAAAEYYEKNCHCSRHENSANRECWDSLLTPADRKALIIEVTKAQIN